MLDFNYLGSHLKSHNTEPRKTRNSSLCIKLIFNKCIQFLSKTISKDSQMIFPRNKNHKSIF